MNKKKPPLILIILDGWGYRKNPENNAILAAKTPNWDYLWKHFPHTLIEGAGKSVGLPQGQMGNSEVGHLNMGAGRIVFQDLTRIDSAIENGEFNTNETLIQGIQSAKQRKKAIHILGLLSPGGVHSHENHIFALIKLISQFKCPDLFIHAFLDGRDTPPQSALSSIEKLQSVCAELHCGKIATIIGRFYAMDRDKRWERIEAAYNLIVQNEAEYHAPNAIAALEQAYKRGETDEFVKATCIEKNAQPIEDGDVVFFMNFRSDRARELTQAFLDPNFKEFPRTLWPKLDHFICLSEYDKNFPTPVAFPPQSLEKIFPECISNEGLKQLRLAETEKYAHVTFFFSGGREAPFEGEDRVLIPSLKVATYDKAPKMRAEEITDRLVQEIIQQQYAVIICNFANPDMVGHTGNWEATIEAIEVIDHCLGKIFSAIEKFGGEILITADHGNAEQMYDLITKQPHTAHTSNPVPFIYVGQKAKIVKENGKLSDIAPTMLYLLGMTKPPEMTGNSLLERINTPAEKSH